MNKQRTIEQEEALTNLRKLVKPGDTIYTVLRHASRSGMYRRISLHVIKKDGPHQLDYLVIKAGIGEQPRGNAEGVGVGGCGMDMGFHLVYNLGARLWPKGTTKPHGTRNGEPDRDGGYALKHRWL